MGKNLKSMVFKLLENVFASQKIKALIFFHAPQAKLSPRSLSIIRLTKGKLLIPPTSSTILQIYFPPSRKGSNGTMLVLLNGYYLSRVS